MQSMEPVPPPDDREDVRPVPEPDSPELADLGVTGSHALIYGLLYRRRDHPPTMNEIRAYVANHIGPMSQADRRVRDLRAHFDIPSTRHTDGEHRYELTGWRKSKTVTGAQVSGRVRAEVLAPGRCAMCGATPIKDGVRLAVDHKIPREWGGGNEVENLQPLCEKCNGGKQDRFASYDAHADMIRAAIGYEEPHRRIGELLKAFDGEWVPGQLIEIVASAIQYQEDWQKRTRELRMLGWTVDVQKRYNEGARVRTYYRATHWEPWGEGPIVSQVRAVEKARREAKKVSARGGTDQL